MIILINGAFGVGKTTVAESLHHHLKNSMLYDPEIVGFMLREMLPSDFKQKESPSGDFQDYFLWKQLVVETAKQIKEQYNTHLIVPMTIRNHAYFTHISEGFKALDHEVYSFCLAASKETIHRRLVGRGEESGNWCFQQTTSCLEAYDKYEFGFRVDTEDKTVEEVVREILSQLN